MEGAVWMDEDEPLVGVVSDVGHEHATLASLVEDYDARFITGSLEDVLASEPSILVTVGDSMLTAAARATCSPSLLPVGSHSHIASIPGEHLSRGLRSTLEGETTLRQYPLLTVETSAGTTSRALFEVTLITDEPARISEYGVHSRGESIAQFRADGVVVATPAGSDGYAAAANGASVSSAIDGVAVVPIAPFVTHTRQWILPDDDLSLSVERDEGAVAVCVDDHLLGTIGVNTTVSISVDETLSVLETQYSCLLE